MFCAFDTISLIAFCVLEIPGTNHVAPMIYLPTGSDKLGPKSEGVVQFADTLTFHASLEYMAPIFETANSSVERVESCIDTESFNWDIENKNFRANQYNVLLEKNIYIRIIF